MDMVKAKVNAAPSIRRLPSYLHIIRNLQHTGDEYISGSVIAEELNVEPIQVRKDLAITGIVGTPKKGFHIETLINSIEKFLGWDAPRDAALIGVGNLGSALLGYQEFPLHGLNISAAFDINPRLIGYRIHGIKIMSVKSMNINIRSFGIKIAILTVPSAHAQKTADILVNAGIEGIWNFTNVKLRVPDTVVVQQEDLSSGFAMLCIMMQNQQARPEGRIMPFP
jgi:redox-sensing transcriptional repressor